MHILPSVLAEMDENEKAFIFACAEKKLEEEKKQQKKMEKLKAKKR